MSERARSTSEPLGDSPLANELRETLARQDDDVRGDTAAELTADRIRSAADRAARCSGHPEPGGLLELRQQLVVRPAESARYDHSDLREELARQAEEGGQDEVTAAVMRRDAGIIVPPLLLSPCGVGS